MSAVELEEERGLGPERQEPAKPRRVRPFLRLGPLAVWPKGQFKIGHLTFSGGAQKLYQAGWIDLTQALHRHVAGDWGEAREQTVQVNEAALAVGKGRVFSCFRAKDASAFQVVTDLDAHVTMVVLPRDMDPGAY